MKIIMTLLLSFAFLLSGCATNQHDVALEQAKYDFVAKSQEVANRPLFMMTCPQNGCVFDKLAVNNPNAKVVSLPKETNFYDFANSIVQTGERVALGATPWLVTGKIAVEGIKHAGDVISDSYNDQSNASVNDSQNDHSDRSFAYQSDDDVETQNDTDTSVSSISGSYNTETVTTTETSTETNSTQTTETSTSTHSEANTNEDSYNQGVE